MAVLVTEVAGHQNQHDRTLEALAEAKNWKQALVHIEKRLKKTKNDRLTINKALISFRTGDGRVRQQAISLLEATLQSMSPVVDNDVLHAIEDAATTLDLPQLHAISSVAWEKTLKARPNDEGLLAELFERKISALDWDAARKLAMTRMKANRDWYFRYLICLHLSAWSGTSQLADNMKMMNAGLAIKSLQKSASEVIADPDFVQNPQANPGTPGQVKLKNPSPSKSLETQRELDLLVEIFRQQQKHRELLTILEDDTRTGLRSRIGNTFGMLKDMIDSLVSSREWQKLWQLCDDLLRPLNESNPRYKFAFGKLADDWGIWQAYLQAGIELSGNEPQKIQESLKLMIALARAGKSPNAALLTVDHGLQHMNLHANQGQDLLEECKSYYSKHCQKPFIVKQLKNSYQFSAPQRATLLSHAKSSSQKATPVTGSRSKNVRRAWLYSEINSLKLDYYLTISNVAGREQSKPLLKAFINTCLNLYRIASTITQDCDESEADYETLGAADRKMGDDAAILAAIALIHLYIQGDSCSLLRAALVLEMLLTESKHNYDGILLAVRVYIYLGQIGRAVELFQGLDIKNIQNLSTFWIIGCRLSVLHPHSSKKTLRCDPIELLDDAASWINRSSKSIKNAMAECLEEKSYRNLLRTIRTFESSKTSIPQIMVRSERSAVHLFSGSQTSRDSVARTFGTGEYSDNRDVRAFPNYEHPTQFSIEEQLRPGPLPKANWCQMQQRLSALRVLWLGQPIQSDDANDINKLFSKVEDNPSDLTTMERINDQVYQTCFDLILAVCRAKEHGVGTLQELACGQSVEELKALCNELANGKQFQAIMNEPNFEMDSWYLSYSWYTLQEIYHRVYLMGLLMGAIRFFAIIEQDWKISLAPTRNHFSKEAPRLERAFCEALRNMKDVAKKWQAALKDPKAAQVITQSLSNDPDGPTDLSFFLAKDRNGDSKATTVSSFVRSLVLGWLDTLDGLADINSERI